MAKSLTQAQIAKLKLILLVCTVCLSAQQFKLFHLLSNGAKSLSWTPKKLWPAWEADTQLYELMYRLPQDSKSSASLARVALIQFMPMSDKLIYRFLIEVDEGFSKLNIQREITLTALNNDADSGLNAEQDSKQESKQESKQNPSNFLQMIHQGYNLSWRELSQEKAGFWSTSQEYLNSGKVMISLRNEGNGKVDNQQWCRSWSKARSSAISQVSPATSQVYCTHNFPLPDELWPFLVMSKNELETELETKLKSEASEKPSQFELYSPLTGQALGTLKLGKLKLGKLKLGKLKLGKLKLGNLNQGSSQSDVHLPKVQIKQQEWIKQRLQAQTKYTLTSHKQTLLKFQEHVQAQDLWTIRPTTWGMVIKQTQKSKTHSVSDRRSLQEMRKVRIKGSRRLTQNLHGQSWLSIDLNSPFPPLNTDRQQVKGNPDHIGYAYNVLLKAQKNKNSKSLLQTKSLISLPTLSDQTQVLQQIRSELIQMLGQNINDIKQATAQATLKLSTGHILNTLLAWMQSNMTYQISRGSSSLAKIIERKSGDCNELSWLFVELLKSMGIQAEMLFGLVHVKDDVWAYHAWAQVQIGQAWHIVDPSRFELYPHVAYIAFSHGSMEAQEQLGSLIGRVNGKLLSSSH